MPSWIKRAIFAVTGLLACSTVILFIFHEGAQSALDSTIRDAQNTITNKLGKSGSPQSVSPSGVRLENATFFTLCQNSDLYEILSAVHDIEVKFNDRFHYDWVFLNDEDFNEKFKDSIQEATSGTAHFGTIDKKVWGYPEEIDLERAAETRKWMKEHNVVYGDKESYHHMCRFQSLNFYKHPLMQQYRYAWRVEPGIQILCKQKDDPFHLMRINDYAYGFNIAPQDIRESITTLWNSTKTFLAQNNEVIHQNSLKEFISDDNLENYNLCHFWTNFEISDLDWLRSDLYERYVNFLDKEGGFYYERWGDAPIRSIAASLFLPKEKVHFFNEIGYYHAPYGHCPYNQGPLELECDCHPRDTEFSNRFYDYHKNSCMKRYFRAKGRSFYDANPDDRE